MRGVEVVRRGDERLRLRSPQHPGAAAHLTPGGGRRPPTAALVSEACARLARRGHTDVVTAALPARDRPGFIQSGFAVREELHLLAHDLFDIPRRPDIAPVRLRRGWWFDHEAVLDVDALGFDPFWRLDRPGLREALSATPKVRFRLAVGRNQPRTFGYVITGRSDKQGYVQRLAVDPAMAGRGIGKALVVDALAWLARHDVTRVVVNTQVANDRALALYDGLGFRLQPSGLAVLGRHLGDETCP